MSSSPRPQRPTLTRDRVVEAAVAVADAEGLGGLTIRSLAARLDVTPMAIYHHVANKEEIHDLLVEAVLAQVDLPQPGRPWRTELRRRCDSLHHAVRRHPWSLGLLDSRRSPGPATLAAHDALIGTLLEDGFSVAAAARAFSLIDAYVYGFTLQQTTMPIEDPAAIADVAVDVFAAMGGSHPYLARLMHEHALKPGYDVADEFAPGLELVLDAAAGLRGSS